LASRKYLQIGCLFVGAINGCHAQACAGTFDVRTLFAHSTGIRVDERKPHPGLLAQSSQVQRQPARPDRRVRKFSDGPRTATTATVTAKPD
jgi:hypothetical protein